MCKTFGQLNENDKVYIINDLEKIVKHCGIRKQVKEFAKEAYELEEAVIEKECNDDINTDHIAEELADVMVLWEQIRLYYGIPTQTIKGIISEKVNRQLKRMEEKK